MGFVQMRLVLKGLVQMGLVQMGLVQLIHQSNWAVDSISWKHVLIKTFKSFLKKYFKVF